jgi:hypothetical protein
MRIGTSSNLSNNLFQTVLVGYNGFGIEPVDVRGMGLHIRKDECKPLESGQTTLNFLNDSFNVQGKRLSVQNDVICDPKRAKKMKSSSIDKTLLFEKKFGINMNEIDLSIIPHLPVEIQKELELLLIRPPNQESAMHYSNTKHCNRVINEDYNLFTPSQMDPEVFEQSGETLNCDSSRFENNNDCKSFVYNALKLKRPMLALETDYETIKSWVEEWTSDLKGAPLEQDFIHIERYLVDCINSFELETCKLIMDLLILKITNSAKGKENSEWQYMKRRLIKNLNATTFRQYGSSLYRDC